MTTNSQPSPADDPSAPDHVGPILGAFAATLQSLLPPGVGAGILPGARFEAFLPTDPQVVPRAEGMLRRQREFARGRHCAVQALQQVGWRSTESLVADAARELGPAVGGPAVGVNPDRSPVWPAGYVGSISHSRHWVCAVAAATADYRGVGLDTEVLIPAATRDLVREEVASEQEWALLQSYLPAAQAVTTLFSAKESFFKLWYPLTQQFLNFRDVELQAVAPVASARASSVAPDEPRIVLGLTHRPGNGQTLVADFHEVHARWVGDDVITLTWLPTSGPPTREPGADG